MFQFLEQQKRLGLQRPYTAIFLTGCQPVCVSIEGGGMDIVPSLGEGANPRMSVTISDNMIFFSGAGILMNYMHCS